MMKKYKLIKELPFEFSPKIGYISKPMPGGNGSHYWNHNWFDPENYPEFWQEITESEFEILELKLENSNMIWKLHADNKYRLITGIRGDTFPLSKLLRSKGIQIQSVKRLSDGQIFTIGDLCYPKYKPLNAGRITKFELISSGDFRVGSKDKWYLGINDIGHKPDPSFITDDGISIYPGDKYHIVNDYDGTLEYDGMGAAFKGMLKAKLTKYFSTREKALEYIDMNEPKVSKQELRDIINDGITDEEIVDSLVLFIDNI